MGKLRTEWTEKDEEEYKAWLDKREALEIPQIGDIIECTGPAALGWQENERGVVYAVSCLKADNFPNDPKWELNPNENRGLRIILNNQPKEDVYKVKISGIAKSKTCIFGSQILEPK